MTRLHHSLGIDLQNHRFAVTSSDFLSNDGIDAEMDMLPGTGMQPLSQDGFEIVLARSVKEQIWRRLRSQSQIDRDRVSLIGADLLPILADGKALLVTGSYHLFQKFPGSGMSCRGHLGEKQINLHPALFVQADANGFRTMPQNQAEKFAGALVIFVHWQGAICLLKVAQKSGEDALDCVRFFHPGQSLIESLKLEGQPLVIDA